MTRERQTTQARRARTTGSLRHGGRPPRRDPDRREGTLGATQRRLRRDRHSRRRGRVGRGVEGVVDDDAHPVGVVPGHHGEPPILVPTGSIRTAHGVMKGLLVDRDSRSQSQHGLEEAQGIGVITEEILRLAKQGFREQPETAVTRLLVPAVASHHQVVGHPDGHRDRVGVPTRPVDLIPGVVRYQGAPSGEPNRGLHLGESSGHRREELGAHHRGKAPRLLVVPADQEAPATRPLVGVGMR